jgi:hypothetical protein
MPSGGTDMVTTRLLVRQRLFWSGQVGDRPMNGLTKTDVLRKLTFGSPVAEEERKELKAYFVATRAWDRIQNGEIDIIYGTKGAGKSALYVLAQDTAADFAARGIIQVSAENLRGQPAFKDLNVDPPTSEREFISIWKLYFASLLGRALSDNRIDNGHARASRSLLDEHDLLPLEKTPLGSVLAGVRAYIARWSRPTSVEAGMMVEPVSGAPTGFTGKIVFEDPSLAQRKAGFLSVDDLLAEIDAAFGEAGFDVWIMIDRLDVAFDETSELEANALRALFRAYRDIRALDHIVPKIFLRSDIWGRIAQEGFREATHLSRDLTLRWDKPALKHLIIRRLLNNPLVNAYYDIDKAAALSNTQMQDAVFNKVFPEQVEVGAKQSTTLDWILRRTTDGNGLVQPRDVIFFLNILVEVQNRRLERGDTEPPETALFDRSAFKEAMFAVSEYKVEKSLFAERPDLRPFVDALREQKTEHNVDSLSRIWKKSNAESLRLAEELVSVGFFEERTSKGETSYWVPFVYRSYLVLSQGKVEEMREKGIPFWEIPFDGEEETDIDPVAKALRARIASLFEDETKLD